MHGGRASGPVPAPEGGPSPGVTAALLVAVSAAVRVAVFLRTEVIGADSFRFVAMIERFAGGDWEAGLAQDYHPLFPLLASFVARAGVGAETSGYLVSIALGSLAAWPLCVLLRDAFGARAALAGGLLFAFHPLLAGLGADVRSDATHHLFLLASLAIGWRAVASGRLPLLALSGAASGAAYLARPEGLGAAMLVGAAELALGGRALWRRVLGAVLVGAMALMAASPYIAYNSKLAGSFTLTRKKSVVQMIQLQEAEGVRPGTLPPGVSRGRRHVAEVPIVLLESIHPLALALAVFGLARRRAVQPSRATWLLAGVALLWTLLAALLFVHAGYLSRRHVLPITLVALGFAGAGLVELSALPALAQRRLTLGPLCALAIAVFAPKTFQAQGRDQVAQRQAGEWIRAQANGAPVTILTPREKVPYYARSRWVIGGGTGSYPDVIQAGRAAGATWVAVYAERDRRTWPDFVDRLDPRDLALAATFRDEDELRVYRLLPASDASPPGGG